MFLITLVMTLGSLLAALDFARLQLAQARLQASLDAGVDAALEQFNADSSLGAADWRGVIEPWVLSLYPTSGFVQTELTGAIPELHLSPERLVAEIHGDIRLLSTGLLDVATADLLARRTVLFREITPGKPRDVVLAVDVSLLDTNPIRDVTIELASQLLAEGARVAVVPYSDTINLSALDPHGDFWLHPSWKNQPWFEAVWRGCVSEFGLDEPLPGNFSYKGEGIGAMAPMVARVPVSLHEQVPGHVRDRPRPNVDATANAGNSPHIDRARYSYKNIDQADGGSLDLEVLLPTPANCRSGNTILPFSQNTNTVLQHIQSLTADPQAGLLPVGLLWAWRTLITAPPWNTAENPQRAIIFITDGMSHIAPSSAKTQSELEDIPIDLTFPTMRCPQGSNCRPGEPGTNPAQYTFLGSTDVAANIKRQDISAINTDGPQVHSNVYIGEGMALWAVNNYTAWLCQRWPMNTKNESDIELYVLNLDKPGGSYPDLMRNCVGYNAPERYRQFNAGDWAHAVNETVRVLTFEPHPN